MSYLHKNLQRKCWDCSVAQQRVRLWFNVNVFIYRSLLWQL